MENDKNKAASNKDNKDAIVKPDPETLHTTDPEEHMKGPLSSLIHNIMEGAEKEDSPKKKEQ